MKKTRGTVEDAQDAASGATTSVGTAAVERLFSGAGRDHCSLRHGMKADRLEQVM